MQTTRARLASLTPFTASLSALLLAAFGSGCEPADPLFSGGSIFCSDPVDVPTLLCDYGGSARISTIEGLAVASTANLISGTRCLSTGGSCPIGTDVFFQSQDRADRQSLNFGLQLPPTDGPGSYPLGAGVTSPTFYGALERLNPDTNFSDHYYSSLRVLSGVLVVTRNDASAFRASFNVEVETEDGLHHVTLTGGKIDITDCKVGIVSTCYDP